MAQATILAAGTNAATSTDIVVTDGASKTVGMFADEPIPGSIYLTVMMDTPGDDLRVTDLTADVPAVVLAGPGTYRVVRKAVANAVGVFTEG